MRLAEFILRDMPQILARWEAFAATRLPAARSMTPLALRDHAAQILQAVAKDLSEAQSQEAQAAKSMGMAPRPMDAPETAAQTHGLLRAQSGFDINQMASEYRALRASVLSVWMAQCRPGEPNLDDVIRFNEAIDQALAESVAYFAAKVDESRNLFLGMLGHDMRTPLQAIQLTATYLSALHAGADVTAAAQRLVNSGARMQALLDGLVEFNRTKLGLGLAISPTEVDLSTLFADEIEQVRAAHPGHCLEFQVTGPTRGRWDGTCLQRLLGNLLVNAIKYGDPGAPVRVKLQGGETDLRFEVSNAGAPIDAATLEQLFDPLTRGGQDGAWKTDGGLGLGLYISREIARAHGGEIQGRSERDEVSFSVRLPRNTQPPERSRTV